MTQPPQGNDPAPYDGQPPSHQPPPYGGEPGGPSEDGQPPPKKSTGLVVGIVVAALLVTAGAVGAVVLFNGDNESDSPNTATKESTSAPTTPAETASADPTTSAAPPTSTASPTAVDPPIGDGYCQKLRGYDRDEGLKSLDFSTRAAQQKIVDVLEDLESEAPSQLKDDYEVVIDGFISIRDKKPQEIDQTKFTEAFTQIGKDAAKNCGVDMGS